MTLRLPTRKELSDDRGFTMTELVVAMGLLTIFMAIFTTFTSMMASTTTKVTRIADSVQQNSQAFLALDKSVRYASAIAPFAVTAGGTWHIEYDTANYVDGVKSEVCNQLRITNQQLQRRTWTASGTGYTSLTAWRILASNVTNGTLPAGTTSSDAPFSTPPVNAAAAAQFQRVTMTIVTAGSATVQTSDKNRFVMTFAALNSTPTSSTAVCQQVAVDATS